MFLQKHRLEADFTYRELAERLGLGVGKLHQLLNNPVVVANERTTFKVRRYLATATKGSRRASA